MALDLSKLNKEQKEAVAHGNGPLLIVAGAGTGKTTVITQRIVNLIEKKLAKPEEILAVTFTEKAAFEMEERVDKLLDFGYIDLWISTFHSFCEKVLRENALDIGLPLDFKILDGTSGWLLARQNLEKFDLNYYRSLGNPTKFIQALISHFSHCKDQEIYPEDYLEYANKLEIPEPEEIERIKEVAKAYATYQKILLENSSLDFGDLINYCLKLFKKRPLILRKYREKFKYILVDEFQDTNWSQYELIKLLAEPNNNLTVCADDDQAIYRWRGASFSNIVQFGKDFLPTAEQSRIHDGKAIGTKLKKISLIKNYRSCQNILDQSYSFIKQNNPDRLEFVSKINKKLIADTKERGIIEHIHAKNLDREVGETLKKIFEIKKSNKNAVFNDFAILVRANDTAIPYIKALERANLPYQFLASRGLYSKPIILDIISYFKLLDNYHESAMAYRILNLPFLEISGTDIAGLTQYSHKKTKSLFEAMQELPLIPSISKNTREKVLFILSLIKKHSEDAKEKGVAELLLEYLEDFGYLKYIKDDQEKIDLVNQFLKKVKAFEESAIEPTLKNFVEQIGLELEAGEDGKLEFDPEKGPDMIKVMTIHGAKGLEFKYVFLVGMVDRRFPTDQRKDPIGLPDDLVKDIKPTGDVHLQEERRLCYVAMTRAKRELYFTSSEDYGGQRKKKLSRFLTEMGYRADGARESSGKTGIMAEKMKLSLTEKVKARYLPDHFSFSQLAAFEKCPLQYKFAFIIKVPVRGKAVFSFGHTIHNTLYDFFKLKAKSSSAKASEGSFVNLLKIYERNWVDEWYDSKQNKEKYKKLGKEVLERFYKEYKKDKPVILKTKEGPALELPFNLKIGGNTIIGKIDRIDDLGSGQVQIIDYKTGTSKDKPEKEQLLIYQMAASEVLGLKPKLLSYYYLEDGKVVSFLGSENDIANQKAKILEEIEKIKNSEFEPTPGWQCQYCDFKDICDHAQRG